jgi:hypothetical protein
MSDPYDMDAALAEIEAENPQTYTFNGTEYPCSTGDETKSKDLGFGGYAPQADMTIVVRNSTLPDPAPALKDQIFVDGREYHLDTITDDHCDVFQVWALNDPNKAT